MQPRSAMILAGFLALVLSAFMSVNAARAATGRIKVIVAGQAREVLLIETERLKRTPRTLIIVLGNVGSRARLNAQFRRGIGLSPLVRGAGVIVAYPDAVSSKWNLGAGEPNDVEFVRALSNKLVADGAADRRRIFLAGVSSGGFLALKIACDNADYVAGIAVMIGAFPRDMVANCKVARPMNFMLMNGTADPLLPWQGGKSELAFYKDNVASAEETMKVFAQAAQCSGERTKTEAPDRDPNDGSRVVVEKFSGCKAMVELVRVDGGGHTLPGRPARSDRGTAVGAQNNDVSTPRVIWDFVRRAMK